MGFYWFRKSQAHVIWFRFCLEAILNNFSIILSLTWHEILFHVSYLILIQKFTSWAILIDRKKPRRHSVRRRREKVVLLLDMKPVRKVGNTIIFIFGDERYGYFGLTPIIDYNSNILYLWPRTYLSMSLCFRFVPSLNQCWKLLRLGSQLLWKSVTIFHSEPLLS